MKEIKIPANLFVEWGKAKNETKTKILTSKERKK